MQRSSMESATEVALIRSEFDKLTPGACKVDGRRAWPVLLLPLRICPRLHSCRHSNGRAEVLTQTTDNVRMRKLLHTWACPVARTLATRQCSAMPYLSEPKWVIYGVLHVHGTTSIRVSHWRLGGCCGDRCRRPSSCKISQTAVTRAEGVRCSGGIDGAAATSDGGRGGCGGPRWTPR